MLFGEKKREFVVKISKIKKLKKVPEPKFYIYFSHKLKTIHNLNQFQFGS